jgi:hypothetical protein
MSRNVSTHKEAISPEVCKIGHQSESGGDESGERKWPEKLLIMYRDAI